jgi:hypothetical protein
MEHGGGTRQCGGGAERESMVMEHSGGECMMMEHGGGEQSDKMAAKMSAKLQLNRC